ncbi:MAG: putative DNA modification/repair radical SAM protein [Bacillota bacterium]|nr:putative DNA modification/repair radical SAM protein [Bacillota bacterium]
MDVSEKLRILGDAAKYDASCSSSGSHRKNMPGGIGNAAPAGCCHSFTQDGRCISLLKVLLSNCCINDCKYCINRKSNDVERATFEPRELANLTIEFYKRNYIEGLFLSSGIIKNPDYTMEQMIVVLSVLRNEYKFNGYIHVKAIPGADQALIQKAGLLADRMSVNIELPSEVSLNRLAPDKDKNKILKPMGFIKSSITESKAELAVYRHAPQFVPSGQSTQMIIGATGDTDCQIMRLAEGLYNKYSLKRVYYSAYVPMNDDSNLPSVDTKPPLLREHRIYQADWLLRFYGFKASELLDDKRPNFSLNLDPKADWAIGNYHLFPLDVNKASYEMLLRVPGIGVTSARRIITARRMAVLEYQDLKKFGVVLKRAQFFITVKGKYLNNFPIRESFVTANLSIGALPYIGGFEQISMFSGEKPLLNEVN